MIRDEGWLELAEVVSTTPINNNKNNFNIHNINIHGWTHLKRDKASRNAETAIHVFCSRDDGDDQTVLPLTSFVVQPSPVSSDSRLGGEGEDGNDDDNDEDNDEDNDDDNDDDSGTIDGAGRESSTTTCLFRLHPVMFFFLHHASCATITDSLVGGEENINESKTKSNSNSNSNSDSDAGFRETRVQIAPLPMLEFQSISLAAAAEQQTQHKDPNYSWKSRPVPVQTLKKGSHIHVSCVYVEDDDTPWLTTTERSCDDERNTNNNRHDRCVTGEQAVGMALEGRIVREGSVLLLSTIVYGYAIARVTYIGGDRDGNSSEESNTPSKETSRGVYRLSDDVLDDYRCHIRGPPIPGEESSRTDWDPNNESSPMVWERDVPGYEGLLREIMDVFRVHGDASAATGVVLTGCAGVGKSRLASCIAHRFLDGRVLHRRQEMPNAAMASKPSADRRSLKNETNVYYCSVQDLVFQASAETNLLENVLVPKLRGCRLWIVDDLNFLETLEGSGDEVRNDSETMMVQNALVEAIDRFHRSCCILGIAQSVANLPLELTKSGRLETTFQMLQPTQLQRIEIWKQILANENGGGGSMLNADAPGAKRNDWIPALASSTAGCVPRDLLRIYRDAKTKAHARQRELDEDCGDVPVSELEWEDLREAIKSAIPSQLSELDVIKPIVFDEKLTWKEIHLRSWQDFAGYPLLKKSVYRQVVVPWRFFLQSLDESLTGEITKNERSWLEPPPGVLFHGISGAGKTVAAKCLAVSLGLPIIQVRATDLLDKWLGGSESLLRSLFTRARAVSPCVLFLDEIDAIACNREEDDNNDVSSRILSTLLNEMDGVSSAIQKSRVLVIACTNRIRSMDSALLRPGRLQEHFHMGNPDVSDLEEILKLRMERIPKAKCLDLKHLALALFESGATGADVGGLCREATFIAMRRVDLNRDGEVAITQKDFISALADRFGG
mmetsp:Transcript_26242/g.72047  ORF Transcript_26242/g.72047 Transcript_26242/m.72047 type:complete len:954 (-) Transcript_26242:2786-5647(-)